MRVADESRRVIRCARLEDLDGIGALEDEVFAGQQPYQSIILRQLFDLYGAEWVVAEVGGVVAGYVLTFARADRATVFTFAVADAHRRRGIGRRLLERAVIACAQAGVEVVSLTVHPDNTPARKLFEQTGFDEIEFHAEYFGGNTPRYVLERRTRKPAEE